MNILIATTINGLGLMYDFFGDYYILL